MSYTFIGIPVFRDKHSASVIIGALRQANLPDELSKQFGQIFCCFLYPTRFWVLDSETNQPRVVTHKPSHLSPLQVLLVDSLLHWYDGKMVTDYSRAIDDPSREFLLRAILLFWCGDYPGLGEASNCSHAAAAKAACHWCLHKGEYSKGLRRTLHKHFRRWLSLHPPHSFRTDPSFGAQELRPPPPLKKAEDYFELMEASETSPYVFNSDRHPRKESGVNGWCPLYLIPEWNMWADFLADLMHIVKNWFDRCLLELLSGLRSPKRDKKYKEPSDEKSATYAADLQEYEREQNRFNAALHTCKEFSLTERDRKTVDLRLRQLSVVPDFIKTSMVWFDTLDGRKKPKAADWLKIMRRCLPFLLADVGVREKMQALVDFTEILRKICEATCDFSDEEPDKSDANLARSEELKVMVIEGLCKLELALPESEFSIFLHECVHIMDSVIEWNSPRNFWCFITERFVGYCKGFVKNRHLYMANLVTCAHTHTMHTHTHTRCTHTHARANTYIHL